MVTPRRTALMALMALGWLTTVGMQRAEAKPSSLMDAYKKEFAFLEAEKQALTDRRNAIRAESNRKVGRGEAEIRGLQQRLLTLRGEADRLEEELRELDSQATSVDDPSGALDETLLRANTSLEAAGVKPVKAPGEEEGVEERLEALQAAFERGGGLIDRQSRTTRDEGSFFLVDGARVDGELLRIGAIATYGVSDRGAGALAPAGQGRLRLWFEESGSSARALATGASASNLRIFLHESLEKGAEQKQEETVLEFLEGGGVIGWVIVGLGGVATLLILIRVIILLLASAGIGGWMKVLVPLVERGKFSEAQQLALGWSRGPASRVVRAALLHLNHSRQQLEDIISESLLNEVPHLERFASALTVIAAVAPLMGLLGTVTGMISTFDVITEYGTGDPKLLSGGISEALVTTELGLIVAIPTLLIGTLLTSRSDSILADTERAALQILNAAARAAQAPPPLPGSPSEDA